MPSDGGTNAPVRRHVIIVIGDGMQLAYEIATSRYLTGRDDGLSFHAFPEVAYKTTWDVGVYDSYAGSLGVPYYARVGYDPTVGYDPALGGSAPYPILPEDQQRREYILNGPYPDSASAGTAMSTGFKTDSQNLAWLPGDPPEGALETSAETLRRYYQMSIGYVTSGPFPHATPAAWFSHSTDRYVYYPISHEILTQMRPEVVIGGGAGDALSTFANPDDLAAVRASGEYVVVERELGVDGTMALLAGAVEANQQNKRLLGLFGSSNGSFVSPVPLDSPGDPQVHYPAQEDPSLGSASIAALEVLSRNPHGFFLLVEQEDIDMANHDNDFRKMVGCVADLDQAVADIVAFVDRPDDQVDWTNTTVLVTADHANGYLRLERPLGLGDLPTQRNFAYPDSEISYGIDHGRAGHTNELVMVYARGVVAPTLKSYATVYPGLGIIDDTAIHRLTLLAARR